MTVIAVYNIKGGVGKTATAVNLAYLSAAAGARTLLWDLDPQAAATFYFRVRPRIKGGARKLFRGRKSLEHHVRGTDHEGLDLLPADFSYRHLDLILNRAARPGKRLARLLRPCAASYDHVFLDCAPSISLVSEAVFSVADVLLVPTLPTTLSQRTLSQLHGHLGKQGHGSARVLPFHCIVDRRKALHREIVDRGDGPYRFLDSSIPYSSEIERMGLHRSPLPAYSPASEASASYDRLWRELMREICSPFRAVAIRPRPGPPRHAAARRRLPSEPPRDG